MTPGYDYDAPDSIRNLPDTTIPAFEPNFRSVLLEDQAVLTDLVGAVPLPPWGFLVSQRFRAILDGFVLALHKYFPVPMVYRGHEVNGYWWLHLPQPDVMIPPDAPPIEAESIIQSSPELAAADMFRFSRPERFSYCFVSAPLRRAIEAAQLTGIRFGTSRIFR